MDARQNEGKANGKTFLTKTSFIYIYRYIFVIIFQSLGLFIVLFGLGSFDYVGFQIFQMLPIVSHS